MFIIFKLNNKPQIKCLSSWNSTTNHIFYKFLSTIKNLWKLHFIEKYNVISVFNDFVSFIYSTVYECFIWFMNTEDKTQNWMALWNWSDGTCMCSAIELSHMHVLPNRQICLPFKKKLKCCPNCGTCMCYQTNEFVYPLKIKIKKLNVAPIERT